MRATHLAAPAVAAAALRSSSATPALRRSAARPLRAPRPARLRRAPRAMMDEQPPRNGALPAGVCAVCLLQRLTRCASWRTQTDEDSVLDAFFIGRALAEARHAPHTACAPAAVG